VKGKNHVCGPCTFTRSGTPGASWQMGLVSSCRETSGECAADVEDAEKRFHVPVTSSEALSANRRCCRDMEALFSVFHVGEVGVGVVVVWRGRYVACTGCVYESMALL
jgi:hypothetical protein